MSSKSRIYRILPVMFSFFVMGFVDVVGISTSYVKADFGLSDKLANLIPMMVFLWFAIFSLPTGALMSRIGRRKVVMLSAIITLIAMLLPLTNYSFTTMLLAFALLGIGNTILQVSLNPLLMDVVDKDKMTSMLTLGQFIKAICSTLGPIIVSIAAGVLGSWRLIFPIYAAITLLSWIWLAATPIDEKSTSSEQGSVWGDIKLLCKDAYILMLFSIIVLSVGFEIGLMTAVPKYLTEVCAVSLEKAGLGCSLYYIARTIGTFAGAIILAKVSSKRFLSITMLMAIGSIAVFMVGTNFYLLLVALFAVGLLCANIFAIAFSAALGSRPKQANAISALMIMGVAGGALLPPVMGVVADAVSQWMSLVIPAAALIYIFIISFKLKTN